MNRKQLTFALTICIPEVKGLLLTQNLEEENSISHKQIIKPMVFLNSLSHVDYRCDTLNPDYMTGFKEVLHYLHDQGHSEIGYIGYTPIDNSSDHRYYERFKDFRDACEFLRVPLPENRIFLVEKEREYSELEDSMVTVLKKWKKTSSRPTAVLAYNDLMAAQLFKAAAHLDIDIPGDLSVIGIDNELICETLSPALTSISPEFYELGAGGIKLLLSDSVDNNRSRRRIFQQCKLIKRESVQINKRKKH